MNTKLLLIPLLLLSSNNFGAESSALQAFSQEQDNLCQNLRHLDIPLTPHEQERIRAAEAAVALRVGNITGATVFGGTLLPGLLKPSDLNDCATLAVIGAFSAGLGGCLYELFRTSNATNELQNTQTNTFRNFTARDIQAFLQFPHLMVLAKPYRDADSMTLEFAKAFASGYCAYPLFAAESRLRILIDTTRRLQGQLTHTSTHHTALPDEMRTLLNQCSNELDHLFLTPTVNNHQLLTVAPAYNTQLAQYHQAQQTFALQNQTQAALNQAQAARDAAYAQQEQARQAQRENDLRLTALALQAAQNGQRQ